MQAQEEGKHQELMTLVDLRTGGGSSTGSIRTLHSSSSRRSILLPARPKIFYGRDHELHEIVTTLKQDSPRLVLLGTGGIGKTSLALSVLYHEQVAARFKHRHFISCESAANGADIVSAIAEHLGVAESVGSIIEDLSASEPTILVLDNFESPWEPFESRSDVEGLLSRLAGIQHVALLVTMRGAERPGQVRWTRPFLAPLSPLSRAAAMQTLSAIVDHEDDDETRKLADTVLDFTDNLPLAVQLIGAVASFEGFVPVIKRWQLENTALLSEGPTKGSNLDNSISLSLSSPRMLSIPSARQLLGVLSLLPDGLPDTDLAGLNLPISDSGKAKAALLRTSLAYAADGRLKMLAPVREYVQRNHPPAPAVLQRLVGYISELLNVWKAFNKFASGELVPRLKSSAGNVRSVLLYAVETDQGRAELIQTGKALLLFIQFLAVTGTGDGGSDLRKLLPSMVERAEDDELHGLYMVMQFSLTFDAVEDPEALALKAVQHFRKACRKNPICLIRADET
ncbi:P-loop containing nucleoside triphosphate hydrolase protein [Mycena maculata]|uniref:P-loop containing nucleoside triphosphate hydrolase protein n=1 Tax=Mycena maculata TaxID=230809 RepID=A0AAD7IFA0_9AGAR|nr:P-loop containing nucleoside triphosphate hydrolase protein [Mycena maculata]